MSDNFARFTENDLYRKTPQELTALLYEACMDKLRRAITAIEKRDYILANRLLQRCNDILYRLGAGLNYEAGMIADQLEAIYNYMADQLIKANISKSIEPIKEVLKLIDMIAEGWAIALGNKAEDSKGAPNPRLAAYEQGMMYEETVRG